MSDTDLGSNLIVDEAPAPPSPPPPPAALEPVYVMSVGERFTREQYHAAGWTDDQLIQTGKMAAVPAFSAADLQAPIGMPDASWVILEESDDIPPTGLFVGHNGTGYLIKTGVPVPVPNHVLQILDEAVQTRPVVDPETKRVVGHRDSQRYAYRRVAAPVAAE